MNASALIGTATSCGLDARVVQGLVSSTGLQRFVRQPLNWAFAVGHPDRAVRSAAVRVRPLARR
jgi:hypothetical protein